MNNPVPPWKSAGLRAAALFMVGLAASNWSTGVAAAGNANTILVLDASGSMWGRIDGRSKIEIARDVVGDLLQKLPADEALGLYAYGHRRKGDCGDIEQLVPAATGNRARIRAAVDGLQPKGKTPLSEAVKQAAESLRYQEERATVVLISDGKETCERDPCAMGSQLEAAGIDLTVHVVGFDVEDPTEQAELRCLAENTGGRFYAAKDAAALQQALGRVAEEVAAEPQYPEIRLDAPDQATVGEPFEVSRNTTVSPRDFIALVPIEAAPRKLGNHVRAGDDLNVGLRAQADPGLYELRYVLDDGREVLASRPIELVEARIRLQAPDSVVTGADFQVSRNDTISGRDFINIVPPHAKDAKLGYRVRTRDATTVTLRAPAEPGLYEVRYILDEGRRAIARRSIEVIPADITLQAPDAVTAGATFEVVRNDTVNGRDFINIVPPDAKDAQLGNRVRTRDDKTVTLRAPAEPGLYEVRYVLDQGRKAIARRSIEVRNAEISLQAPESVTVGANFEVGRSGTVNGRDFIVVAPPDAADGKLHNHVRARDDTTVTLRAPAEPGLYEVRYVLDEGRKVIARAMLEVRNAEVALTVPDNVSAGDRFPVGLSASINGRDIVAMVPMGTPDGKLGSHARTRGGDSVTLTAPDQPGLYEVRYVLDEGRRVLARAPLEVLPLSAAIVNPEQVVAAAAFSVDWQGPNRRGDRLELVSRGAAADAAPIDAADAYRARDVRFTAPAEAGPYALRYRLGATDQVIAETAFEVVELSASVSAPASAAAGSTIEVSWTGPGGDRDRIVLARPEQSPFQWVKANKVSAGGVLQVELPATPGSYEFRYLDVANRAVLAKSPIQVQ